MLLKSNSVPGVRDIDVTKANIGPALVRYKSSGKNIHLTYKHASKYIIINFVKCPEEKLQIVLR